jgi:hypothetical protein
MVTLNEIIRKRLGTQGGAVAVLDCLRNARESLLPMYRERFHSRVPDPGDYLRHCGLHDIAFYYVEPPSAFKAAWSHLRQLGKIGIYSDEDVDKQIGIMLSELDQMETEVRRLQRLRDDSTQGS